MLVELSVDNVAILERAKIELGSGFTVFTGETGAGKSLLVDAMELVIGARAESELVRSGASRAVVDAVFDISDRPEIMAVCDELGVPVEEGQLFVQREVFAEGRSQVRLGGKLAPLSNLRRIGSMLVDISSQHDSQSLLEESLHLEVLDAWIGARAYDLRHEAEAALNRFQDIDRRLESLRKSRRETEHRLDMLRFQVSEIESFQPAVGEFAELESASSKLKNAERFALTAADTLDQLADGEGAALDRLGASLRRLEELAQIDAGLSEFVSGLESAKLVVEETARAVRNSVESLDDDPARLDEVQDRLDGYRKLFRKYGDDENAVIEFLSRAKSELELLDGGGTSEEELESMRSQALGELDTICANLTDLRKARGKEFALKVTGQLAELAMDGAIFEVQISAGEVGRTGADIVAFLFSANRGEPIKPLSKVASGGELSRLMLAMKTVLAGTARVPTLVFDEIDAGLSGRIADVVGRKLEAIAERDQVLVISHLPQIASRATTHFRIAKQVEGGRTVTRIEPLDPVQRVDEIARLLAGDTITDTARKHATKLLELL